VSYQSSETLVGFGAGRTVSRTTGVVNRWDLELSMATGCRTAGLPDIGELPQPHP